jgi:polysaccharide export outer membrane protein
MKHGKWTMPAAMLLACAVAVLPGQAQEPDNKRAAVSVEAATYIIGPLDVLQVNVWKEPEMSAVVPVRPDGKISLPLLHDVVAAGFTPMQLAETLTEKMKEYIAEPHVTIVVSAVNSRRVYLLGEINRVGPMDMLPNMTVLQALAAGGGFSQFANLRNIYVLRFENGKQVRYPFNYRDVIRGQNVEHNILLKPGDTIVVP